jgi:hypothetical protein
VNRDIKPNQPKAALKGYIVLEIDLSGGVFVILRVEDQLLIVIRTIDLMLITLSLRLVSRPKT